MITIETSQRGYRLFAPVYDIVFGAPLQHHRRRAIDALDCKPGERVLEVCVGSGLSLPLYPAGVRVTGIDASREMLTKAARRVGRLGMRDIPLLQMDAQRLAFPNASFDKAVMLFALSGLSDPVQAVREIQRVCVPGATFIIANRFRSQGAILRACDALLSPIHGLLRYRSDLDLNAFIVSSGLDLLGTAPAGLWGYSTILVCRNSPDTGNSPGWFSRDAAPAASLVAHSR